jgi:hypothetical protein
METKLFWKAKEKTNTPSVGKMLKTSRKFHFKKKIILCNRFHWSWMCEIIKKIEALSCAKFLNFIRFLCKNIKNIWIAWLAGNVILIDMRKTKIKRAHKITDYLIVVKEANRVLWERLST